MNESLTQLGSFFFPQSATVVAGQVDTLFYFIFVLSIIFFVAIVGGMVFFVYRYREGQDKGDAKRQITHNTMLELTWIIIPFILVMIIFYWGFVDYLKLTIGSEQAYTIHVTGKKWMWVFDYPDTGKKVMNDLVVPVNRPIKLVMSSEDTLHSFYVPNMRIKRDVLPNRYATLSFTPNREGNFQIFCTEYCGDGHSTMLANMKVVSEADFLAWQQSGAGNQDVPLPDLGEQLYEAKLCSTCHSVDGSKMIGPSWQGLYQAKRQFSDGTSGVADANYLRESIVNPHKKIVVGYTSVMPVYAGLLSDHEINAFIAFIKELEKKR